MFLISKKIIDRLEILPNSQYTRQNFFIVSGKILLFKKFIINWQIKNKKLICIKINNRLLILPKEYYKILRSYCDLKNCHVHISYNNLTIINKKKYKVYKASFNNIGLLNLKNNYNSLKYNTTNFPSQIITHNINNVYISEETFLPGHNITLKQIHEKDLPIIIQSLDDLYLKNKKSEKFNISKELNFFDELIFHYPDIWKIKLNLIKKLIINLNKKNNNIKIFKTRIHGDLTYKNIILYNKKYFFYDLDRSCYSFPEFDIWLLSTHWLTYKEEKPSYAILIHNIFNLIEKNEFNELHYFYSQFQEFQQNLKIIKTLKYIFLFRIVVLSLQNFQNNNKEPIDLLNITINKLKNTK